MIPFMTFLANNMIRKSMQKSYSAFVVGISAHAAIYPISAAGVLVWGMGVVCAACSLCVEGLMFQEDKFLYLIDIFHPPSPNTHL